MTIVFRENRLLPALINLTVELNITHLLPEFIKTQQISTKPNNEQSYHWDDEWVRWASFRSEQNLSLIDFKSIFNRIQFNKLKKFIIEKHLPDFKGQFSELPLRKFSCNTLLQQLREKTDELILAVINYFSLSYDSYKWKSLLDSFPVFFVSCCG